MQLDTLRKSLCKIQGQLFEMSSIKGIDSNKFVELFMNSDVARYYDMPFNHMQWAGPEYMMESLGLEFGRLPKSEYVYDSETMFWMGYLYRFWHFYTGESSKEIFQHINAADMSKIYLGYHTLDCEMAVNRILEREQSHTEAKRD